MYSLLQWLFKIMQMVLGSIPGDSQTLGRIIKCFTINSMLLHRQQLKNFSVVLFYFIFLIEVANALCILIVAHPSLVLKLE